MVHGPPQVMSSTVERHEDFIQIPGVAQPASATLQLSCVVETERLTPVADGFVRNCDASLGEQIFHITETQAESVVESDSVADDLGWKPISGGSWATGLSSAYIASCNRNLTMPHRAIKRRVKAKQGFREFQAARRTIQGYEAMRMIRKGQTRWVSGSNVRRQIQFIHKLFEVAA